MGFRRWQPGHFYDFDYVFITVTDPSAPGLTVTIDGSPLNGCLEDAGPLLVSFTSTVSGGTPPYGYSWDFGHGIGSTDANPEHGYVPGGPYSVSLTVNDDLGAIGLSNTLTVTVGTCP